VLILQPWHSSGTGLKFFRALQYRQKVSSRSTFPPSGHALHNSLVSALVFSATFFAIVLLPEKGLQLQQILSFWPHR
jgi:hypothetical protein